MVRSTILSYALERRKIVVKQRPVRSPTFDARDYAKWSPFDVDANFPVFQIVRPSAGKGADSGFARIVNAHPWKAFYAGDRAGHDNRSPHPASTATPFGP